MKTLFAIIGSSLILAACTTFERQENGGDASSSTSSSSEQTFSRSTSSSSQRTSQESDSQNGDFDPLSSIDVANIPASYALDVPFMPQAPTADWTDALNEACEEAALYNVEKYLSGESMPSPEQAERDLYAMIDWQTEQGYPWDINADEAADVARRYLHRKAKTYKGNDVTEKNIKALIANGYPVIIPAAGQMLGNPYFSGDGPPYHMLVITGYDARGFITNDVGTRRGEDYRYGFTTIMNAIHDWTGNKEEITRGPKAILVLGE